MPVDLELPGDPGKFVEGEHDPWELAYPGQGLEVCNVFSYLTPPDPERMQVLAQGPRFHESREQEYESYRWEALRVWPLEVRQAFIHARWDFDIIEWYQPQGAPGHRAGFRARLRGSATLVDSMRGGPGHRAGFRARPGASGTRRYGAEE